ncbi:Carboxy-terminal processing protease CtpB precursor [Planctomycetes bacterium CA13]|uniref:Carboxy-terminal processing protease CtpB n=1 Tax=Novipirellula herctigrandis TaxID=2527986 RepID=A0A5C5Z1X7_9BACT|nr:Carboxy-terminal processing protease CtpB precursor [Planctomycetes bacterium CA13]
MPPRNLNIILIACCISLLCYLTHRRAKTAIMVGDALDLINTYYVDPIDEDDLLVAAMDGMTSQLDQHSEFIPVEFYESFQNSITQEFAGIGIYVDQPSADQPVRVITPLVGSPALKAGMLPGDAIIKIDGEDVSKMDLRDVSSRLKGPLDTIVSVVVRRGDLGLEQDAATAEEVTLEIRRATIELESVIGDHRDKDNQWVYRLREDPSIAYVRLTSFGDKTTDELSKVLADLDNEFRGMVFDVRGNSGGLLYSAIDIANMFLDEGRIVSTRTRGDKVEAEYDAENGTLVNRKIPVAVLIDENSASASEIVAAALQDNQRAVVVGARSYGKGTVQNVLPLQYGRSALRLTVARYYRPSGKNIHRPKDATEDQTWGVAPNEGMDVSLDDEIREALMKRWSEASYPSLADIQQTNPATDQATDLSTIDPQLTRALEYLRSINQQGKRSVTPGEKDSKFDQAADSTATAA